MVITSYSIRKVAADISQFTEEHIQIVTIYFQYFLTAVKTTNEE